MKSHAKRAVTAVGAVLLLAPAACTNVQPALTVIGNLFADPPDCSFSASDDTFVYGLQFDVDSMQTLNLRLKVQNNLQDNSNDIGRDSFRSANAVRPIAAAIRWECRTSNEVVDDLKLPSFERDTPFCSPRDGTETRGSDTVYVDGAAIAPGDGVAVWNTQVIPSELGARLRGAFTLAAKIDACCNSQVNRIECLSATDPTGVSADFRTRAGVAGDVCNEVQTLILASGGDDQVRGEDLTAYTRWNQFRSGGPGFKGAGLPLVVAGVVKGLVEDGSEVESNDFEVAVEICQGCGPAICYGP